MVPLSQPAPIQCFTPFQFVRRGCASTHFGENQLAPSSIGISPLTTTHPSIFQHRSVGTSTSYHRSFILVMVRSPGFGSIRRDKRSIQTCFRSGFDCILTKPLPISRQLILQQAHGQMFSILPLLVSLWFHGLFHSPDEVLFTFPSRYCFAIGHPRVFSLTRWSSQIHTGFHVPHVTRDSYQKRSAERIWPAKLALTFKKLQDSHLLWYRTQLFHFCFEFVLCPTTLKIRNNFKFRLFPFRSPLLRESLLLSFPLATKMFQFTRLSLSFL